MKHVKIWWLVVLALFVLPQVALLAAGTAWALSLLVVYRILKRRTGQRIPKKMLLLRLPAAALVFSLLVLCADPAEHLVIYAAAFVPPYLILMAQQWQDACR